MSRPLLFSLPDAPAMSVAERELFRRALDGTRSYFEFGAGGSTVWAVQLGLAVRGAESDLLFAETLRRHLGSLCQIQSIDLGPTGKLGWPTVKYEDRFPRYSRSILSEQVPFDLILVDGRFRVACTACALLHTYTRAPLDRSKTRILIHDFWNRGKYHVVLPFLKELERADTAGLFVPKEFPDVEGLEKLAAKYAYNPA